MKKAEKILKKLEKEKISDSIDKLAIVCAMQQKEIEYLKREVDKLQTTINHL